MKRILIVASISLLLGCLISGFVLKRTSERSISLAQNAEILLDGEATLLWDCHLQSMLFNDGAYACVCNPLTTEYVIYPCIYIASATSDIRKCK